MAKHFAYGSNMLLAEMRRLAPSATRLGVARLSSYALRFHKVSSDGSAKCNALYTTNTGDAVIGALYELDEEARTKLTAKEGGYLEVLVEVETAEGNVLASTFIAKDQRINGTLKPYDWYKELVLAGARESGLPEEYIDEIASVAALPDPDSCRSASRLAVLQALPHEPHDPGPAAASRYAAAGVSLESAERATERIRSLVASTFTDGVVGEFGGFGGAFDLSQHPGAGGVLIASADGVGTKLEVALRAGRHGTVGEDLVNHCVNDILAQGARPLFFLDYIGCGRLDPERIAEIVGGVARGCRANGCALLGGETAEMPGLYHDEEYDLVGFIVGAVERARWIDGSAIRAGDVVLGLPSSGLHTNGYSLARKIVFQEARLGVDDVLPGTQRTVAEALLAVHRSYLHAVVPLLDAGLVHGMVHVTGGGFAGNVCRVLPADVDCEIDAAAWDPPALFRFLAEAGAVPPEEMYRVFNMGIGYLLFVDPADLERARALLSAAGEEARVVGRTLPGAGQARVVFPPAAG